MHRLTAPCQHHRDGGGHRRLAHAALAHRHDDATAASLDIGHERCQALHFWRRPCVHALSHAGGRVIAGEQDAQSGEAENVDGSQRHDETGQADNERLRCLQCRQTAPLHCLRGQVLRAFGLKRAVDDELLIAYAQRAQFARGPLRFVERGQLRTAHQHQRRRGSVRQRPDRSLVNRALLFQAGQRAETRRAAGVVVEELIPRLREAHQPQRVAGRGGVEDDMIILFRGLGIADQAREFIKGRDLHRAGAGKLLFHAAQSRFRQQTTHWSDEPLAIRRRGGDRIDVQGMQARCAGNRRRLVAQGDIQHLVQVRRRVGAHQQHEPPCLGQHQRRRTRERGFAHPALAGEEQIAGRGRGIGSVERQVHDATPAFSPSASRESAWRSSSVR